MNLRILTLILLLLTNAAWSQESSTSSDEATLLNDSQEFTEVMKRHGYIQEDTMVVNYLNAIIDRIKPAEYKDVPTPVYLFRSAAPNAFCLANGTIMVHTGLLSLLENEAQLAYILCHELAHFIEKHCLPL